MQGVFIWTEAKIMAKTNEWRIVSVKTQVNQKNSSNLQY